MDIVSYQQFIGFFPSFKKEPQELVEVYLNQALNYVSKGRFCNQWVFAVCLVAAHLITIFQRAGEGGSGGGIGVVTSKSVGSVSVGVELAGVTDGAGDWNLTIYGQEFWKLCQIFGIGGTQYGAGFAFFPYYPGAGLFETPSTDPDPSPDVVGAIPQGELHEPGPKMP